MKEGYKVSDFGLKNLRSKKSYGYGKSKHEEKRKNHGRPNPMMIHTVNTYQIYRGVVKRFCAFRKQMGFPARDFSHLVKEIQHFLDFGRTEKNWSPATVHTYASALVKAYDISVEKLSLPPNSRKDTVKCRKIVLEDSYWEKRSLGEMVACCTGLRRNKELSKLEASDRFVRVPNKVYSFKVKKGKGGLERYVDIMGSQEEIKMVWELAEARDGELLLRKSELPPQTMTYRAEYALRVYFHFARPVDTLSHEEKYFCRKDMKGFVFDQAAMLHASRALGHNRLSVIARSYLWPEMLCHFADGPEGKLFKMPQKESDQDCASHGDMVLTGDKNK